MYTSFLTRLSNAGRQIINAPQFNDPYPVEKVRDANGGEQILQADQALSHVEAQYDVIIPPQNIPGSVLNQGILQYTVPTDNLNYCTNVVLQMQINNVDGTNAITIVPAALMIDNIQIYSGQSLVETVYGDATWLSYAWLTNEQWTLQASAANASSTFSAGPAIPANGSITVFVNIPCHLSQCEIFLPAVQPDYLFKINFRSSTMWTITNVGTTTPTLSVSNLIFSCTDISPRVYNEQMAKYQKNPHTFRYVQQVIQPYTQALAASTSYTLPLNSVVGAFSHFMAMVRSSTTGSGLLTSDSNITSIDVRDNSARSMIGGQPLLTSYLRYIKSTRYFPSQMLANIPFLWYSFAENLARVVDVGSTEGLQTFTGKEQLYFTTGSGITPGTFDIRLYFFQYAILTLGVNGFFVQQNS